MMPFSGAAFAHNINGCPVGYLPMKICVQNIFDVGTIPVHKFLEISGEVAPFQESCQPKFQ